jgi:hypothetical protein
MKCHHNNIIGKCPYGCWQPKGAFLEHPRIYEIAKQITLDAGFPWTDPRTGVTHKPKKRRLTHEQ